jgi:hypothetical protein
LLYFSFLSVNATYWVSFRDRITYDQLLIKPLLILAFLFMAFVGSAQFYNGSNMTFGKNRVQYKEFLWLYYKFPDFDTYYYLNGQELAQFAARYADEQIPLMESKIESGLDKRIQFIIFNNLTDLKQSNVGLLTETSYNTGGITHIIGSKVFLYFDGNHVNFQKQIRAGIAEVLFNQMMFGGTLGQQVKSSTFFSIPEWYRIGIISYLSNEWDVDFDNRVRDGILSGRYDKVNNLVGEDAIYAGHSLWRYIAMLYGKDAVSNIIHMTSVSNSINKGFEYVIGLPFKSVVKEWINYYKKEYEQFENNESHPLNQLQIKYKKDVVYGRPTISPFGKYLAYTSNELGKYKIFLYDLDKGKKKKLMKRGVMIDTKTDYSYPLLAWHPTGKLLAIMVEEKGLPRIYFYDVDEKKFSKQNIYEVQKITDMAYSDNGRYLVMSAVKQGQSDLFVFNIAASSFNRITDDIYSELNPRFINNSSQIVFSSNRINDTLGKEPEIVKEVPENFDLFIYNYYNRSKVLKRITETPLADEIMPENAGFNTISYLSDENGIYNNYLAVIDSTVSSVDTTIHYRYFTHSKPVTNYSRNISQINTSVNSGKRSFVYYNDNLFKIIIDDIPEFDALNDQILTNTPYMNFRKKEYDKYLAKQKTVTTKREETSTGTEKSTEEEVKPVIQKRMKQFHMVYIDNKGNETIGIPKSKSRKRLNKEGYPVIAEDLTNYFDDDGELAIPKRRNYRVEYFINNMVSQIDFNYLNYSYQPFTGGGGPIYQFAGFQLNFQVGVTDLMEDRRIVGGVRFNLSLINNEYLLSYSNLKGRLDKEIIFHRNSINVGFTDTPYVGRVYTHELFYILKYPFNEALSLRGTFTYRNEMINVLGTDKYSLEYPNSYYNWLSAKAELVFDNTRPLGMNLYKGLRYKIFAEYFNMVAEMSEFKYIKQDNQKNLIVLGFDVRNYTKIHRNFIWANRIAGSTSFGASPLIYYMGGVDNWIIPKFNTETPIDNTVNYAYQTLATNMRGFHQNIRNGNNFLVINSELRFPVFQFFSKTPISSSFLRNFQLVAFGDIGTAWTGASPYSPENSLYTRYVDSGPLHVSVEIQKEPIVGGFGAGARIHLLGYFVRGDIAWGVEDYKIRKPVFYISLSLDF